GVMSDKTRREIELIADALDEVEPMPEEIAAAVSELPVTPAAWAAQVRARVTAAQESARQAKLQVLRSGYTAERDRYEARRAEPVKSKAELQLVLKNLVARAPREIAMGFLKYEDAPPEEL